MKPKINSIITYLMPLCLMSSGFVNLVLFYFGLHAYDDIRRSVSIVILSIVFALSLMKLLFLYQDYPKWRMKIIALCCIPALWIIAFITTMIRSGIQNQIVFTLESFGVYCIPAFIFAISIAIERTEVVFIKSFKWYALIIAPLMLFYVIRIIITPEFVYELNNFGAVGYLTLGYTLVPILMFCIMDLFLHKGKNSWLNIAGVILLWIACIFTGAKGPLICLLAFLLLFTVYLLIQKQKDKIIFRLFAAMFTILLFFIFVYSPPSAGIYRTNIFIADLKTKIVHSLTSFEEDKELFSKLEDNQVAKTNVLEVLNETTEESSKAPSIESNETTEESSKVPSIESEENIQAQTEKIETQEKPQVSLYANGWERMFLYKLAIKEGNNHPLTGLGPMGFTLKYGLYPHNVLMEIVADFGYIISGVVVFILLFLIISLYRNGHKDAIVGCMLIYILSCILGEMLSGTVYSSIIILFFLGYACALPIKRQE